MTIILWGFAGTDDEFNTLAAGTATGLLYKSTAGLRKCAIGGVIGLSLSAIYCLATSKDRIENMLHRR